MEFTSIKLNQRLFQKWKNHKTIISNLPNECNYKTFNIKYPIIQAGMIWVSGHKLASAVSNAGGLGLIGADLCIPKYCVNTFRNVKKTSKPFKCSNVVPNIEEIMKIIVEEGVKIVLLRQESKTWTLI
jgi:enoyl-[acyl-carrier protein] reductase II